MPQERQAAAIADLKQKTAALVGPLPVAALRISLDLVGRVAAKAVQGQGSTTEPNTMLMPLLELLGIVILVAPCWP